MSDAPPKNLVPMDMVAAQAMQKLIQDQLVDPAKQLAVATAADTKPVKNPTIYIALANIPVATGMSGPMLIRAGQQITSPGLIKTLLDAKAPIKAVG